MKFIDDRQIVNRAILQELFPWAGNQTLDVLMASLNADCTPPLKVDATQVPSLVVNIGPAIVANPESGRNKSISFINNIIPAFLSGTVTFPSTNGGTITTSTSQTYTLNLPSGQYVQALLALDTNGNLIVTMGTPNASLASAVVPPPASNTLPFAYITLQNIAGVVKNIVQQVIYQFAGAGGGAGGSGGGVAEEVALTVGTTSITVTFPIPQAGSNYVALAQMVNTVDADPQFQPVTITDKTPTGFTATWNDPLDTTNYFLDYIVSGVQEQVGEAIISISGTSITVTLPIPLSNTSYVVMGEFVNTVDPTPQFQPLVVTAKTTSSFTLTWNDPVDTANYRLAYQVASY